jgi:CBS domain-containing protein
VVTLSVRGLRIRVTAGWLVTYLLLVATLVLWHDLPDVGLGSDPARAAAVLAVPILLLPTVVAHELAHLAVARRLGARMRDIDLRVVGMSRGHGSAPGGPSGEALVAIAGPLTSLCIGLLLLGVAAFIERAGATAAVAAWAIESVAVGNLVLGSISLYPGYPMDGSDLVHAIAWRISGSQRDAARWVVRAGVLAGWGVMLVGLGVALRIDPTAGMWVTLLGWSLGRVARHARDQERMTELVDGLTVADATEREVAVVNPTLTLDTLVAQHRLADGPGMFPVVRSGALVGVIDVRDVGRAGRSGTEVRVADRMRPIGRVRVVTEGQRLWDAVVILERDRVSAVPVVAPDDRGRLLGLVTRPAVQRLMRARARRAAMRDAVMIGPRAPGSGA